MSISGLFCIKCYSTKTEFVWITHGLKMHVCHDMMLIEVVVAAVRWQKNSVQSEL